MMTMDRPAWSPLTDDVLAEHREVGMTVHRPVSDESLEPACRRPGTYYRYGTWVVRLEVGHGCKACFPKGLPR